MGASTAGHAVLVSVSQKDGGFGGNALASPCGGPPQGQASPSIAGNDNTDHVHVFPTNAAGNGSEPLPFYVVVLP